MRCRFLMRFLRWWHSAPPTECRHCKKPHVERDPGSQTTSSGGSEDSVTLMYASHLELAIQYRERTRE